MKKIIFAILLSLFIGCSVDETVSTPQDDFKFEMKEGDSIGVPDTFYYKVKCRYSYRTCLIIRDVRSELTEAEKDSLTGISVCESGRGIERTDFVTKFDYKANINKFTIEFDEPLKPNKETEYMMKYRPDEKFVYECEIRSTAEPEN